MPNETTSGEPLRIEVQARKYDGRVHRRWPATVVSQAGTLLVLDAAFAEEIRHPLLGTILPGTLSTEYYWTDRWYNVFRFCEPTGALRNYYCNVNTPAIFDGHTLSFTDLDIDVLIAPDFSFRVLDEEEFQVNSQRYGYPPELARRAHSALDELIALIESRQFPFTEIEQANRRLQ